jgi:hypothetical protein
VTCDGCGDDLQFGEIHDCPVLGVEVTVTPACCDHPNYGSPTDPFVCVFCGHDALDALSVSTSPNPKERSE